MEVIMVPIFSLWLPILLSAVFVFVISSIFHMVLKYHQNDFSKLPKEEEIMADLQKYNLPPGEYSMPRADSMKEMSSPEYLDKTKKGPVAMMTVMESGPPKMGMSLLLWFIYSIVVGIFAAYIGSRALGPGADYLSVFRFVGTTAFVGYTLGSWPTSIWYKRKWSTTFKNTFDGFVYALFTAGTFGWLWPM
jgi:hypothetical protein